MNILVIAPSWVGDMVMSHSLYQTLKQQHPQANIDLLAPAWCEPLVQRMPEIRHAITMPIGHGRFDLKGRYNLGKSLRNQYDLAIILPNSWKSALVPVFAQIPHRRGWKGESRYGLLNDLHTNKKDYPLMVQRYVALGYEVNARPKAENLEIPKPYLTLNPNAINKTKEQFAHLLLNENSRPVIGFCPGAEFGPAKRWPHYHYATLAKMLIEKGNCIRLFGSIKDKETGEQILQNLNEQARPYCVNLAGETHLNQAVDLIADCDAIVSNDSGLMHVSAALNRPLVALYGPTSPDYTPPLSDNAIILRTIKGGLIKIRKGNKEGGYHQSLIDLKPEQVFQALMNVLAK